MLTNTPTSYGVVARTLHWLIALLILSAVALGLYGEDLPRDAEHIDTLKTLYSLHKTIGVATFFAALVRIVWAFTQPRPVAIHPERRAETLAAEIVHWALYGAMVVMPLSGWISHAAQAGFAPIWWPFGQTLPFVPLSDTVSHTAEGVHKLSSLVLYAALALHVIGALKHAVIDRDGTLSRMTRGTPAGAPLEAPHRGAAPLGAVALWAAVIAFALIVPPPAEEAKAAEAPTTMPAATAGNWQVTEGSLGFTVRQMGAEVDGSLPIWTADIAYDEATGTGTVTVKIDTTALTLGSVTDQAKDADFFDTANHPAAIFAATITRLEGTSHEATGTLTLRGAEVPVTLPFTLDVDGDTARMTGEMTLDRRDFGMGASYSDEATVGFGVTVHVALTAGLKG